MKSVVMGILLVASASAPSRRVQLFDPAIFGKPTSEPVKLLLEKVAGEQDEPYVIWTDVRCGRYVAASTFYRKPVTMDDLRAALDKEYPDTALEPKMNSDHTLWRVESRQFAIQLVDQGEEGVNVIYLHFTPKQEVWKNMMKSQGFKKAADTIPDATCDEWDALLSAPQGK